MNRIALITSYPPRRCGIANYAYDLVRALRALGVKSTIAAVSNAEFSASNGQRSNAPSEITWRLNKNDSLSTYRSLGSKISSSVSTIVIQHEYGLYGGRNGEHIVELMRCASVPLILTLHTVIPPPDREFTNLTRTLLARANAVVVHTPEAAAAIENYYGAKIHVSVIPHGTYYHPVDPAERAFARNQLSVSNQPLIVTAGFVTRNKGIEYALGAVASLRRRHHDLQYAIIGAPHPSDSAGTEYLESIRTLARRCGDSVKFVTKYVSDGEMNRWLTAADICLLPYVEPHQTSSGVLARCLGLGNAIITTDFPYAKSVIGCLTPSMVQMRNSTAIVDAVTALLQDRKMINDLRERVKVISKHMDWAAVAADYASLMENYLK
jgi:polysaccharide biosynthesis protein PslF